MSFSPSFFKHFLSLLFINVLIICLGLAACSRSVPEWQGYVEGQFTAISPNYSGILIMLYADRGSWIHKGDPLFVLDPEPESDIYMQAQANVEQAKDKITQNIAAVELAEKNYQRNLQLFKEKNISQADLDNAVDRLKESHSELQQSKANLTYLEATLSQAGWQKNKKVIYSPKDALVFDKYYLPGEFIEAAHPVLSLLSPEDIEIVFFVDESTSNHLHIGQSINIKCDSCQKTFTGKIIFISPQAEYTPPVIYSNDTRAKLVYRIKAKTSLKEAFELHPGEPVSVTLQ